MRVLVVGQGGREHALAWRLARSASVTAVFAAPGNAGIAMDAKCVAIPEDDRPELLRFIQRERIDLAVIGPEAPLVAGLADFLREKGVATFGPSAAAAELEASKIFCKRVLRAAGVPTAAFQVCERMDQVGDYLDTHPGPVVVKADGLAAGKGVVVCQTSEEAWQAAGRMLERHEFGKAGDAILLEELLPGTEVSVFAVTDGSAIVTLDACHDYKRALDGDQGPNTGGMGSVCPTPRLKGADLAQIERDLFVPVVHEMRSQKRPFQGVLFAGLMLTQHGPKVLEFNVRFGDPETQSMMMRFRGDLGQLLLGAATGKLKSAALDWDPRTAVTVVAAAEGYPGAYRKGAVVRGLESVGGSPDAKIFHAGTQRDDDRIITTGGRVLAASALGATVDEARTAAYGELAKLKFTGMQYRRDIGF